MIPQLIDGSSHEDARGTLGFNNNFDALDIKRIYVIENKTTDFVRAWQGHQIEQRWYSAMKGSFQIELIAIANWDRPDKKSERLVFTLNSEKLDVLHIPPGYVSSIQSLVDSSKLLVMADYMMGTIEDEYRFENGYFE